MTNHSPAPPPDVPGMGAAQAARHHSMKRVAEGNWTEMARGDTNPTKRAVDYLHEIWRTTEHGGYNDRTMIEALKKYAADHPDLTIEIREEEEGGFCVALVTPLMRRVHKEMREAGEVVFVDGTASVDRLNTAVHPLLCATPAGAAPLGMVFTSSQDESCLTAGTYILRREYIFSYFYYILGPPERKTFGPVQKVIFAISSNLNILH